MNDFFDFVIEEEKINGSDVVKINKIIKVVKGYSGRLPNVNVESVKKSESNINNNNVNNNNINNQFIQQENSQPLQAIPNNEDSNPKLQTTNKQITNAINNNNNIPEVVK